MPVASSPVAWNWLGSIWHYRFCLFSVFLYPGNDGRDHDPTTFYALPESTNPTNEFSGGLGIWRSSGCDVMDPIVQHLVTAFGRSWGNAFVLQIGIPWMYGVGGTRAVIQQLFFRLMTGSAEYPYGSSNEKL